MTCQRPSRLRSAAWRKRRHELGKGLLDRVEVAAVGCRSTSCAPCAEMAPTMPAIRPITLPQACLCGRASCDGGEKARR
jgi:hypothetical protein